MEISAPTGGMKLDQRNASLGDMFLINALYSVPSKVNRQSRCTVERGEFLRSGAGFLWVAIGEILLPIIESVTGPEELSKMLGEAHIIGKKIATEGTIKFKFLSVLSVAFFFVALSASLFFFCVSYFERDGTQECVRFPFLQEKVFRPHG
jgi:hypothetical protein